MAKGVFVKSDSPVTEFIRYPANVLLEPYALLISGAWMFPIGIIGGLLEWLNESAVNYVFIIGLIELFLGVLVWSMKILVSIEEELKRKTLIVLDQPKVTIKNVTTETKVH